MALESATYINDLVSTNPLSSDQRAQGDDHLRLIKAVVKATFPNASKPMYLPSGASLQTGTVNVAATDDNKTIPVSAEAAARTVNLPAISGLPDGFEVEIVKADHTNNLVTIDGASSETINGALTLVLYQRYQSVKLKYVQALSGWLAKLVYIPPIGEVTPWTGATAAPDGWLFPNGQTIGDASSSATARANADCQGLYYHLWTEFSNTVCPVSTGRGLTAAADWAAHKTIGLPNLAGDTWVGLDNLGGISDAGRLNAGTGAANTTGQTNGEQIGSDSNTLSIAKLPVVTPAGTIVTTIAPNDGVLRTDGGVTIPEGGLARPRPVSGNTLTATSTFTGTPFGSGESHANVQPSFVSAWKIKL